VAGPQYNLGGFGNQLSADDLARAYASVTGGQRLPPGSASPAPARSAPTADNNYNATEPGNIDLSVRPHVINPDGSISTVRSMGFNDSHDGKGPEVLIPTVNDAGYLMTGDEAIREYDRTGKHLGKFASVDDSNAAAEAIHLDQEKNTPRWLAGVERAPGKPKDEIASYVRSNLADRNAQIALAQRGGEEDAASMQRRADMSTQAAEQQRGYNEAAKAEQAQTKAHRERLQHDADEQLSWLKNNVQPPSKSAGERVWGVLGGILAMAGNGNAAAGVQLISQLAGSGRQERWQHEQQARSALYQHVTRGIDLDNATEEQHFEVARRMGAADAMYWANAIEAEKSKGMGDAMKREADNAVLMLREKARGLLRADAEQRQAQAAAAAKSGLKRQLDAKEEYFWRVPLDQLREMPSQVLGEVGAKVLGERTKQDQAFRGGEEEIAAKRQKNAAGPSANLSADERKVQRLLAGVAPSVKSLRAMAERGEAPPHPYTEYAPDLLTPEKTLNQQADINAVADILLRDESGAAIGKDEQQKKLRGWGITSGDPKVRARGLSKMLAEYDARLHGAGGQDDSAGGSQTFSPGVSGVQRGDAPAASDPLIPMVGPGGVVIRTHPSKVEAMRAKGFTEQTVAGGSFIRQPADLTQQQGGG